MTRTRERLAALGRKLREPVDGAWLGALRVGYGLALAFSMGRFLHYGWIDDFFVRPKLFFKYWGFAWVEPLSATGMHALFWAMLGLSLCVAAGVLFRVSSLLFALGLIYVQLIDVSTYLNHYYLAALLALPSTSTTRCWASLESLSCSTLTGAHRTGTTGSSRPAVSAASRSSDWRTTDCWTS